MTRACLQEALYTVHESSAGASPSPGVAVVLGHRPVLERRQLVPSSLDRNSYAIWLAGFDGVQLAYITSRRKALDSAPSGPPHFFDL